MDQLSLRFSEAAALQAVDNCTDLNELKRLTRSLVKNHFQSRGFMELLLRQNLEEMQRRKCISCPENVYGYPSEHRSPRQCS